MLTKDHVENLVERLTEIELLTETADVLAPGWEDDYTAAAVESGRKDYSILDFAADVVREELNDESIKEVEELISHNTSTTK